MKDLGLYIHIPFCNKKCYYCDFLSFSNKDHKVEEYINALILELSLYIDKLKDYKIRTIFIGGGTPSLIDPRYVERLLQFIYKNFNANDIEEVTIEVNPGTLTSYKAQIYKRIGVNRVSIGLQSFNDQILKSIGRTHSVDDFYESYEILQKVGFDNINIDMIFGLPNQDIDNIRYDLRRISQLDIKHLSYYSLIIEPNTPMYKWYEEDKLVLPNEVEERQMYYTILDELKKYGYKHYEISNFAQENYECQHNNIYWQVNPYLGVGIGSHSNLEGKRFWNINKLDRYIEKIENYTLALAGEEIINKNMEIAEYCILGIRFVEGISLSKFKERFGIHINNIYKNVIQKNMAKGLLYNKGDYIRLTPKGLDLANQVEVDFLP